METLWYLNDLHYIKFALICIFLLWCLQWLYNRRKFIQMVNRIPGPHPSPIIGNVWSFISNLGGSYATILGLFKEYPGLFRIWIGPKVLIGISNPKYLSIVLNNPKSMNKTIFYRYIEEVVGEGLLTLTGPAWKRHRKIISPTFNRKFLEKSVGVFVAQCEILMEHLEEKIDQGEFNLFHYINQCTLDIISESAMGVKVNAQKNRTKFGVWIETLIDISFYRMFCLKYHFDSIFRFTKLQKELTYTQNKFETFTKNVIINKRQEVLMDRLNGNQSTDKHKSFLDLLINMSEEDVFTNEEINNEVRTFITAGSDTTANALNFLFSIISMHPDIQEKLHEEAISVLGPDRSVRAEDIPSFIYTEQVIKEVLRIFPVTGFVSRRVEEDLQLDDDVTLPKGAQLIIAIFELHRNAQHWPEPLRFDPDRFDPAVRHDRHPYAYIPFSAGPRNCIGMKYAMMDMKTIIPMLVRKYRFRTSFKSVEEIPVKLHIFLKMTGGSKIAISLRNP